MKLAFLKLMMRPLIMAALRSSGCHSTAMRYNLKLRDVVCTGCRQCYDFTPHRHQLTHAPLPQSL
eukprot:scaffold3221_cov126-Skeletonema_marinoi.AAC.28